MSRIINLDVSFIEPDANGVGQIVTNRAPRRDKNDTRVEKLANGDFAALRNETLDLRTAVEANLSKGMGYPHEVGERMKNLLGWANGLSLLPPLTAADLGQFELQFTVGSQSAALLPELVPVAVDGLPAWLDVIGPCSRYISTIATPARSAPTAIAVLYQVMQKSDTNFIDFPKLAKELKNCVPEEWNLSTFPGDRLDQASEPDRRKQLDKLFGKHRVVLFLGHFKLPDVSDPLGGWCLTANAALGLTEVARVLDTLPRLGKAVPELVFANCCGTADRQASAATLDETLRPAVFLGKGVRFYIGTSMLVCVNVNSRDEDENRVRKLAAEFFQRYLAGRTSPSADQVARFLWEAKRACDSHLVTALYQLYVGNQPPSPTREPERTVGAVVASIAALDRLGDYTIDAGLWDDPHARTFAAIGRGGKRLMLSVLADRYQDTDGIGSRLAAAVERLQAVSSAPGVLVPNRHEVLPLTRGGDPLKELHVLVFDRPGAAEARPLAVTGLDRQQEALVAGAELARGLAALHAANIAHGAFEFRSGVELREDGKRVVAVKDAWLAQVLPGLRPEAPYAPPAEPDETTDADAQQAADVYGLGAVLHELATDRPPPTTAEGPNALRLLPALARVIRDCRMPVGRLLPDAETVSRRLQLALGCGGAAVGDLESRLNADIQTGHRVLALLAVDPDEASEVLTALAATPFPRASLAALPPGKRVSYQLYVATEGVGLQDPQGTTIYPWQPTPDNIPEHIAAATNVALLFQMASRLRSHVAADAADVVRVPVVMVVGDGWWWAGEDPSRGEQSALWRTLRSAQASPGTAPIFVFVDRSLSPRRDVSPLFVLHRVPPLTPPELLEEVADHVRDFGHPPGQDAADVSMAVTRALHPAFRQEARDLLRMAGLRYGVIDERVAGLRDDLRASDFRATGTATYTPPSKLPTLEALGLPVVAEEAARRWVNNLLHGADRFIEAAIPRRVLITGGEGCGKTTLARALAGSAGRPLVRLDANSWLRGRLGESESALHSALDAVDQLHRAVVLFDELDRFLPPTPAGEPTPDYQPTLTRMAAILFRWLDRMAPGIAVVLVAREPAALPPECRRRIDLHLELPPPVGNLMNEVVYRANVFAAVFRLCGLVQVPHDLALLGHLAAATQRVNPKSPMSRLTTVPHSHTVNLGTGADIEAWVHETITLHPTPADPADTPEFWLKAI